MTWELIELIKLTKITRQFSRRIPLVLLRRFLETTRKVSNIRIKCYHLKEIKLMKRIFDSTSVSREKNDLTYMA